MSYNDYEKSSFNGQPVELLEIQYGPTDSEVVRTTSGDRDVVVGGNTYYAFTTSRDEFDDEGNPDDAKQLSIRVPRDHPFIQLFDQREFPTMVAVRIKRAHLNDPELGTFNIWSGRLVGVSFEAPWMVLGGEKIATALTQTGCRIRYMRQCPHTLYMPRCWVDKEQHKVLGWVSSMSADKATITISGMPSPPAGHYLGGILMADGLSRFIVKQNGSTFRLSRPLLSLTIGKVVTLYPGCDRLAATCKNKFNNLDNYGGFDFIPPKGPFEGISII